MKPLLSALAFGCIAIAVAEAIPARELKQVSDSRKNNEVVTPSGLVWVDINVGAGRAAKPGDTVDVHYTGKFTDGKKFDSSLDRKMPFAFTLGTGQVIKGFEEGIAGMKAGGKRMLIIPPELGYGNREVGAGLIPPNSTLIFEIELLSMK